MISFLIIMLVAFFSSMVGSGLEDIAHNKWINWQFLCGWFGATIALTMITKG